MEKNCVSSFINKIPDNTLKEFTFFYSASNMATTKAIQSYQIVANSTFLY